MTKRQKQTLSIIYNYIKDTGYPPTFEEMREQLGVSSNQSVLDLLNKLEKHRVIKRNESVARSIVILPLGYEALEKPPVVPFLGISHAGAPIAAIEISGEWQTLSPNISKLNEEVFLLKVSGDSMVNASIEEGDIILVKHQKEFVSEDIVLADVNGESTIKRFISDNNPPYVYIKPENPNYPVIPFTERVRLSGKVVSVLKKGTWKQTD
ncbi:MAG: transcriptional repressor LexA [Patescibacteria group bacterium]